MADSPNLQLRQGPLQEIGPNERWRNHETPMDEEAEESPHSKSKLSTPPANSPRAFWKRRDPMSGSPLLTGSPALGPPLYDNEYSPTPSPMRRRSLEKLIQASRVRNSNMFAREAKAEYDPTSAPVSVDRPLAAGRPFKMNNPALTGSPGMSPHPHLSRAHGSPSPTRSSLAAAPRFGVRIEESPERSPTLRRQPKSVTFDPAPQVKEFEMCTPDRSSVADSDASYESWHADRGDVGEGEDGDMDEEDEDEDGYEYDYEYEEYKYGFGGDESFDASLEDTDKTPVVMPGDVFLDDEEDQENNVPLESQCNDDSIGGVDIDGLVLDNHGFSSPLASPSPPPSPSTTVDDSATRPLPTVPSPERRRSSGLTAVAERLSLSLSTANQWPTSRNSLSKDDILAMTRDAVEAEKAAGIHHDILSSVDALSDLDIANLDPDVPIPSRETSSQYTDSVYSGRFDHIEDQMDDGDSSVVHHVLNYSDHSRDTSEDEDGDKTPRAGTPVRREESVTVQTNQTDDRPSLGWSGRVFSHDEKEAVPKIDSLSGGGVELPNIGLGEDDFASGFEGFLTEDDTTSTVKDDSHPRLDFITQSGQDQGLTLGGNHSLFQSDDSGASMMSESAYETEDENIGSSTWAQSNASFSGIGRSGPHERSLPSLEADIDDTVSDFSVMSADITETNFFKLPDVPTVDVDDMAQVSTLVVDGPNVPGSLADKGSDVYATPAAETPTIASDPIITTRADISREVVDDPPSVATLMVDTSTGQLSSPPSIDSYNSYSLRPRTPPQRQRSPGEESLHTPESVIHRRMSYDEWSQWSDDLEENPDLDVGTDEEDDVVEPLGGQDAILTKSVDADVPPSAATIRAPGGRLKTRPSLTGGDLNLAGRFEKLSIGGNDLDSRMPGLFLDLPDTGLGLDDEFTRLMTQKRGYLTRQNTKIVVASDSRGSSSRLPNEEHIPGAKDNRQMSGPWTTEVWNGTRRQSNRGRNSAVGTARMASVPEDRMTVPPIPSKSAASIPLLDEEPEDCVERGRLFVKVIGVQDIDLPLPPKQQEIVPFRLTVDNGLHCVTTGWKELGQTATVGQEFELVVGGELEFQLTMQVRLAKNPKTNPPVASKDTLSESVAPDSPSKRSGLSRLLGSPRKKKPAAPPPSSFSQSYGGATPRPVDSNPTAYDMLNRMVAEDGSFARAYVCLKTHESACFGRPVTVFVPCFNEWALQDGATIESSVRSKRGGGIVRKPPYRVGRLLLGLMYVPKVRFYGDLGPLVANTLPRSMGSAVREMERVERLINKKKEEDEGRRAQATALSTMFSTPSSTVPPTPLLGFDPSGMPSGYLTQLGGDCPYWRRRYFRLSGSKLTGYHEHTRQPRATINLAKAVSLSDGRGKVKRRLSRRSGGSVSGRSIPGSPMPGVSTPGGDGDEVFVLVEHAFRVRFANGEAIDFAAPSDEDKNNWLNWMSGVIGKKISTPMSPSAGTPSRLLPTPPVAPKSAFDDEPPLSAWACLVFQREKEQSSGLHVTTDSGSHTNGPALDHSRDQPRQEIQLEEAPRRNHQPAQLTYNPSMASTALPSVVNSAAPSAPASRPMSQLNKILPLPPAQEARSSYANNTHAPQMRTEQPQQQQQNFRQQPQPQPQHHPRQHHQQQNQPADREFARHHKSSSEIAYPPVQQGNQDLPAGYSASVGTTYTAYDLRLHCQIASGTGSVKSNSRTPNRTPDQSSHLQPQSQSRSNFSTMSSAATDVSGMSGVSVSTAATGTSSQIPFKGGNAVSRGQVSEMHSQPSPSFQNQNQLHQPATFVLNQTQAPPHPQHQPPSRPPPQLHVQPASSHTSLSTAGSGSTPSAAAGPGTFSASVPLSVKIPNQQSLPMPPAKDPSPGKRSNFFFNLSPTAKARRERDRLAKEKEKEKEKDGKDKIRNRLGRNKVKSMLF